MAPHRDVDSLPAVMLLLLLHLLLVTQPGAGRHWSVSAAHACATPSPAPAAALPITPHVSPELITALSLLATWGRLSPLAARLAWVRGPQRCSRLVKSRLKTLPVFTERMCVK